MDPDKRNGGPPGPPLLADSPTAKQAEVVFKVAGGTDVAAGLLRRPVLGDGHADPLDAPRSLPLRPPQPCHGTEHAADGWRPCCQDGAA